MTNTKQMHLPNPNVSVAIAAYCVVAVALLTSFAIADDASAPTPTKHQITGLFSPDREADLREVVAKLPDIKLVSVDFSRAEATFMYDAKKAFNNPKPDQLIERFDSMLRSASHSTFGVRPLRTVPDDKLTRVEIPVVGLDCKACAFAAYQSIYNIPGVEMATIDFKAGRAMAMIDAQKTNREALEAALKQKGVQIKPQ